MSLRRVLAIGDPQAPAETVFALLRHHDALASDGRLAADVVLVSMGDHFDYDLEDPAGAGREGLTVLRWLASHDPAQVHLLLGNHDAARVMELIAADDATFPAARALARTVDSEERFRAFGRRYPAMPTPNLIARDYASFTEEQRALVIELLLAGRFHLGLAGRRAGRDLLLTHAGVTTRELALLGLPDERDPRRIAAALDARLDASIDEVRADWTRGVPRPLSLAPLYHAGSADIEGGGLLYHRPARLDRPGADAGWEQDPERPRRFDPRRLPAGLLQVAGHTGHQKCLRELGDWVGVAARRRPRGGLRTLRVIESEVQYLLDIADPAEATDLYLIDGEMRHVPAADCGVLVLDALH